MLKKHGLLLLVIVMIIQLCVPAGMIANRLMRSFLTEKYGTEYKIPLDYVSFDEETGFLYYNLYSGDESDGVFYPVPFYSVVTGEDGFAVLTPGFEKPKHSSYIASRKEGYTYEYLVGRMHIGKLKTIDSFWLLDEKVMIDDPDEDYDWFEGTIACYSEAYLHAYVYNGNISVKEIYIDGIPAKQFIARFDA